MKFTEEQNSFFKQVSSFNDKYNAIRVDNGQISLLSSFWEYSEIEKGINLREEWKVARDYIPFYGDWHDIFCLDLYSGNILYLDDDRTLIQRWNTISEFTSSLATIDEEDFKDSEIDNIEMELDDDIL